MLQVIRLLETDRVTVGALLVNGWPLLTTLELPWRGNKPQKSCIPSGTYTCKRVKNSHFGVTYRIDGVPDRTGIYFHCGNQTADTTGCILVGERWGDAVAAPWIWNSRSAMERFRAKMISEMDVLEIGNLQEWSSIMKMKEGGR